MKEYNCPRCGYITNRKSSIRDHVNRKTRCDANIKDVDIQDHLSEIMIGKIVKKEPKIYICKYCNKKF